MLIKWLLEPSGRLPQLPHISNLVCGVILGAFWRPLPPWSGCRGAPVEQLQGLSYTVILRLCTCIYSHSHTQPYADSTLQIELVLQGDSGRLLGHFGAFGGMQRQTQLPYKSSWFCGVILEGSGGQFLESTWSSSAFCWRRMAFYMPNLFCRMIRGVSSGVTAAPYIFVRPNGTPQMELVLWGAGWEAPTNKTYYNIIFRTVIWAVGFGRFQRHIATDDERQESLQNE